MRAFLVAALLIVAVGGCGGDKKPRNDQPALILTYEVNPAELDLAMAAIRSRLDSRALAVANVLKEGPSRIEVQLQGDADELARSKEIIERHAGLGIHPAIEGDVVMQAIYDAAMQEKPPGIFPMLDSWQDADGGEHRAFYLWSTDPTALEDWLRARDPAQHITGGRRIVFERERELDKDGRPRWRTHVIDLAAIVTGKDVATSKLVFDQVTLQPQVELELDGAGALRFGDATAALVGHKLAIVLDGKVISAPIVQSAIRGGRIAITMGSSGDPKQLEREAHDLVDVLRAGSMPELTPISERHVGPAR